RGQRIIRILNSWTIGAPDSSEISTLTLAGSRRSAGGFHVSLPPGAIVIPWGAATSVNVTFPFAPAAAVGEPYAPPASAESRAVDVTRKDSPEAVTARSAFGSKSRRTMLLLSRVR